MSIDPKRTVEELKQLRALTADENGAQRVAWTDPWLVRIQTARIAGGASPGCGGQPVGDFEGRIREGFADRKPSRLGAERWLAGWQSWGALEVMRRAAREFGGRPPVTLRLVDWADEEGARFGRSLLGSSAFSGTHSIQADRGRTDKNGVLLEDALRRCGVEIDRFGEARNEQKDAAAYVELHIEQGPVLESLGLPLGVVLGTKGVERHALAFNGQEAHSGSPPMRARRDALAAAAKLVLEIRSIAGKHPEAVCTIGALKTLPGIATAVVGRCEVILDQRDLDAAVLAGMYREAREA